MGLEHWNRIHVIGSVGSGKTTLAKRLSVELGLPHMELDNVVWKRTESGDVRRSIEERDSYLNDIISGEKWIIEGAQHIWVEKSFQAADVIIFLTPNYRIRQFRILKRYIVQKIGIESSNYKPTLKILKQLFRWNLQFDKETKLEILNFLQPYSEKVLYIKNIKEININRISRK
jgi:adenylate kinase family enzyme